MRFVQYFFVTLLLALSVIAQEKPLKTLVLVNRVCAIVPGVGNPIVLKDVEKEAQKENTNNNQALESLLLKKALFVYAKKMPSISVEEIEKSADNHVKKVMEQSKLSIDDFKKILGSSPYNTTLENFKEETQYLILNQHLTAQIQSQMNPTKEQIELYKKELTKKHTSKENVAFITLPDTHAGLLLAKKIMTEVLEKKLIFDKDEIIQKYSQSHDLQVLGPFEYKEYTLTSEYRDRLTANKTISEPFKENNRLKIIWKFNNIHSHQEINFSGQDLQEKLKEKLVKQRIYDIAKQTLNTSLVINNCKFN